MRLNLMSYARRVIRFAKDFGSEERIMSPDENKYRKPVYIMN